MAGDPIVVDPCGHFGCNFCCTGLHTFLSEADIVRIEDTGLQRDDFVMVAEEYRVLPQIDDRCIFLSNRDRCEIYDQRPDVCRAYPVVVPDGVHPKLDVECPYRSHFTIEPALIQLAIAVGDRIEVEAELRRGS